MANPLLEHCELLPSNKFTNLHMEIASGEFADGVPFTLNMSMTGDAFYLFTEYPHPDKGKGGYSKCIYVFNARGIYDLLIKVVQEKREGE